jgi:FkbM family methyltransferase
MSVYAVERIQQVINSLTNDAVKPLIYASEEIQCIEKLMRDEQSRTAYQRELTFMALYLVIGEKAHLFADNFTKAEWNKALLHVKYALKRKTLPKLETYFAAESWELPYLYATTFILQAFQYGAITVRPGDVVIDCGARFGEAAIWAVRQGAQAVYAFEPNPKAFAFLQKNAEKYGEGKIHPLNMLPAELHTDVVFSVDERDISVPVIPLDDWCAKQQVRPDYIKFYQDGNLVYAVEGAQHIVRQCRPRLSLCLSFTTTDIWCAPTLLHRYCPDYTFACRKNTVMGDFILYATTEA